MSNLRQIHDFELSLLEPFMAISERGIRIDDTKRLQMVARIAQDASEPKKRLQEVVEPLVNEGTPRRGLFFEDWCCKCCRGGSKKARYCWSCAGFEKSPSKKELLTLLPSAMQETSGAIGDTKEILEDALLNPCQKCKGVGKGSTFHFNDESGDQTKIVLYQLLKLPKRFKDKRLTSDEEALKSLLAEDNSGFVENMLEVAKANTIISIFKRCTPGEDGKIRTFLNPAGTETGRPSGSGGFLEASTNLLNMPKRVARNKLFDVRRCFIPAEGMIFVQGDLSQVEARIVAAESNDGELLLQWNDSSFDVHHWTAEHIFGKQKISSRQRELGKKARHALNYGMGWVTFQRHVNFEAEFTGVAIDALEAKRIVHAYHKLHPKLKEWWERVNETLLKDGSLTTCFGRKRMFWARRSGIYPYFLDEAHKEAIANVPQSTAADLLNRGLLRWWDLHDGKEGELLLQVYDSILVQTKKPNVRRVAGLIKKCLEIPIVVNGIKLTIPCEIAIGGSWGTLEEMEER